ncbi:hypothetical protein [Micromonospora sp. NPDC049204]|uniref:hypothetical protein n=1 Tax=unclassified Micromonospora TaxID=2617518 RepID=UPI0033DEEF69
MRRRLLARSTAIGVEIRNSDREIVAVADVLRSPKVRRERQPLIVAPGRDI